MTIQHDVAQSSLAAEQIAWQRVAAALLGKLLELAAKEPLPVINWTVVSAGAALHGECITYPSQPLRREYFTAWRDAIVAASGMAPDIDNETTTLSGEIRLTARWEWVSTALTKGRRNDPAAHVTLTASIWADDDDQDEGTARLADSPGLRQLLAHQLGETDAREAGQ